MPYFKIIHLLLFTYSLIGGLQAQNDSIYSNYYPFKNNYIDLDNLQKKGLKNGEYINLHHKNSSPYADYFQTLTVDRLIYKGFYYDIADNNGLTVTNADNKIPQTAFNEDISAERYGQHFLIAADSGIVFVKHLGYEDGFKIYKYSPPAQLLFKLQLPHTEKVKTEKLEYFRPYLQYISHNHSQLVFSSYDHKVQYTYAVNLQNGGIKTYNFNIKNVLYTTDNQQIKAFVHLQKDSLLINFIDDKQTNIVYQHPDLLKYNSVEIGQHQDKIALILSNRTGGYSLLCFDNQSKLLLYEKKFVDNLTNNKNPYQKIWLSHYNNYWLVEVLNPTERYLHIYEQSSGKKIADFK